MGRNDDLARQLRAEQHTVQVGRGRSMSTLQWSQH